MPQLRIRKNKVMKKIHEWHTWSIVSSPITIINMFTWFSASSHWAKVSIGLGCSDTQTRQLWQWSICSSQFWKPESWEEKPSLSVSSLWWRSYGPAELQPLVPLTGSMLRYYTGNPDFSKRYGRTQNSTREQLPYVYDQQRHFITNINRRKQS